MLYHRTHIYQLTIPTLPAGGLSDLPLTLDSDAPFALRLVTTRNLGTSGFQFQTPRKQFQSSNLRTDLIVPNSPVGSGAIARPSLGAIVRPPMVYPPSSQIVVNVGNTTGGTLSNVKILFRGSKLFQPGALDFPQYPKRFAALPFIYPPFPAEVPPRLAAVAVLKDGQLRIDSDADFVYRYGVCDPFALGIDGGPTPGPSQQFGASVISVSPNYQEVYITLRDESRKAYSNEPIHIDDWFGQGLPSPYNVAGANNDAVLWRPGLTTPEIYIPREHSLYFDLARNDAAGSLPVNLYIRFGGVKVFAR